MALYWRTPAPKGGIQGGDHDPTDHRYRAIIDILRLETGFGRQGHGVDAAAAGAGAHVKVTSWLHQQRLDAACDAVRDSGAGTVLDLGCGDGELLLRLAVEPGIRRIVGVDLCRDSLDRLRGRLEALAGEGTAQVELIHGSMTAGGAALSGFDCAILVETIEHIDPERLSILERAVFAHMRPATVVITTPNAEFNVLLGVPSYRFRHPDHRFEWGRAKFQNWATGVAARNGYNVDCRDIAGCHPALGGASQMAVFVIAALPGAHPVAVESIGLSVRRSA